MIGQPAGAVTPSNAIDFLTLVTNLKGPESIADHMYRMSMMALIANDASVDQNRCLKIAIVHDVAEAIVGDITPVDGVSDEDKYKLEAAAMARMRDMLGSDTAAGREVEELWQEYEAATSPEAKLVKDFDKLEMILQAQEYEAAQGMQLNEFFDSTCNKWRTQTGRDWAAEIISRRTPHTKMHGKATDGDGT